MVHHMKKARLNLTSLKKKTPQNFEKSHRTRTTDTTHDTCHDVRGTLGSKDQNGSLKSFCFDSEETHLKNDC